MLVVYFKVFCLEKPRISQNLAMFVLFYFSKSGIGTICPIRSFLAFYSSVTFKNYDCWSEWKTRIHSINLITFYQNMRSKRKDKNSKITRKTHLKQFYEQQIYWHRPVEVTRCTFNWSENLSFLAGGWKEVESRKNFCMSDTVLRNWF